MEDYEWETPVDYDEVPKNDLTRSLQYLTDLVDGATCEGGTCVHRPSTETVLKIAARIAEENEELLKRLS